MNSHYSTTPRALAEMLTYVDTFDALLTSTEAEIDNFVKSTHARATNVLYLLDFGTFSNVVSSPIAK